MTQSAIVSCLLVISFSNAMDYKEIIFEPRNANLEELENDLQSIESKQKMLERKIHNLKKEVSSHKEEYRNLNLEKFVLLKEIIKAKQTTKHRKSFPINIPKKKYQPLD